MSRRLELDGVAIDVHADEAVPAPEGTLLRGADVALDLPAAPVRFYRHGWQSWSLATWQDVARRVPPLRLRTHVPMREDPAGACDRRPNASWVGAVEMADGKVMLLGALGLETRVSLEGHRLRGRSDAGPVAWAVAAGSESDVFGWYASRLERVVGSRRRDNPPRVWCTWYSLYTAIDQLMLRRVIDQVTGLPFDVFQVDDGWQLAIGDWEANGKFPSGMAALASRIRAAGFVPGLWLAPLLAVPSSRLYREHPDWLLRDTGGRLVSAGFNWGEPIAALDCSRPDVLAWLAALMRTVREWGFGYVKLDFLYAGALPGTRAGSMPRETAYRNALRVIREALADAYVLACGAPIVPSLGLSDGLRIGPDVESWWELPRDERLLANYGAPGGRNAVRTAVHRLWMDRLVDVDPDIAFFRTRRCRMSPAQKGLLGDLALVCGFKATSDVPAWLAPPERAALVEFLSATPRVERTGRYTFALDGRPVDFGPAVPISRPIPIAGAAIGWLAGRPWVLRLFDWMQRRALARMVREEFTGD